MRVLIFGAAGKMATAVVRRAISAGHDVTAVVRGAGEGVSPNARVMRADASNRAEVDAAMRGQEAVINTILRPAILNDGVATGDVRIFWEGTHEKAHKITREDVATFLVDQLVSNTYFHKTLTIANT